MPKASSKSRARPTNNAASTSNKSAKIKHSSVPVHQESEDNEESQVIVDSDAVATTTLMIDDWIVDYCLIQNSPRAHCVPVDSDITSITFQASSHLEYKTMEQAREALEACAANNLIETCFTIVRIPRTSDTNITHAILATGYTKDGQVYYKSGNKDPVINIPVAAEDNTNIPIIQSDQPPVVITETNE